MVGWKLGLMMRDVARKKFNSCHVHICWWFSVKAKLGTGAPTTTAVGWCNNKRPVSCVWVVRRPV